MSVCMFNNDYEHRFRCEYFIESDQIKVDVEYCVENENPTKDGVRIISAKTTFKDRDILIIDSESKKYYLLKNAHFTGMNSRYGTFDTQEISSFAASVYFESSQPSDLMDLRETPKIKQIRVYSKTIAEYIAHPSVNVAIREDSHVITLSKDNHVKKTDINNNNIKQLSIGDDWTSQYGLTLISIEMQGYIEISLIRRVNYTSVSEYIYELMIYLQLFWYGKFKIDGVFVMVDETLLQLHVPVREPQYTDKFIERSVSRDLLEFLKLCYLKIPYRKSKDEIRNIPYVVMNTYRNIEDNFLMSYKFIECYYKKKGNKNTFITESLKSHYCNKHRLSSEQVDYYSREMIALRNHYIHSGYYVKNNNLRIKFSREKDPRDYTAMISADWILERTRILYTIVIDIIFTDMLLLTQYKYPKTI